MYLINNEQSLKLALISEDLHGDQTESKFAEICKEAHYFISSNSLGYEFFETYQRLAEDPLRLAQQIKSNMLDNYMIAVFVLKYSGAPDGLPLFAWSAENKREFCGLKGEIATMRSLMWAGFDPNIQDPATGATALHSMCNLKWGGGAHPRAVHHLVNAGSDVNATTDVGDTPLITLCGHTSWTTDTDASFKILRENGADLHYAAADGSTAWELLNNSQSRYPSILRAELIESIVDFI